MYHKKLIFLLLGVLLINCSTTVRITSDPEGAHVLINEKSIGKTPLEVSRSDFAFETHRIKLKLEGYRTIHSELEKEFKPGSCAGGVFVLIPFLWVYGPKQVQHYVLEKADSKTSNPIIINNSNNITLYIDTLVSHRF